MMLPGLQYPSPEDDLARHSIVLHAGMPLPRPPAELDRFVRAIGPEATLALIESLGGVRVRVPEIEWAKENRSHQLAVLSQEQLLAFVKEFHAGQVKIPLAKGWRVAVYRFRDGMTFAEIARKLVMTENTVLKYIAVAQHRHGKAPVTQEVRS